MYRTDITPEDSLVDQPLSIRITGLGFGEKVRIKCRMPAYHMAAEAIFFADEIGEVDLGRQAPLAGSYDWIDPMGLIWSMQPEEPGASWPRYELDEFQIHFTISVEGQTEQEHIITRRWLAEGVRREELRTGNLRGVVFYPAGKGPHPAVLVVSGSGGGVQETRAALFADHGYVALTLAYFAYEDRPQYLREIPLEYFEQAAHWLQKQPVVDPEKLVITGGSRGGELSLLLGATFPIFKAVVANVPSSQVWSGVGGKDGYTIPAWTHQGKPVLFYVPASRADHYSNPQPPKVIPIPLTPMFLESMKEEAFIQASTIPVENTRAPILLLSGEDDQMWPSSLFSERVMARLKQHNFSYPYEHHSYPDAGHMIVGGYMPLAPNHGIHPVDGNDYAYGGNPKGQAFANADSWRQVLRFLEVNL